MTAASIYISQTQTQTELMWLVAELPMRLSFCRTPKENSTAKHTLVTWWEHQTPQAPKDTLAFLKGYILTKRDPLPQKSTQAQNLVKHFEGGSTLPMVDDNTNRPTTENRTSGKKTAEAITGIASLHQHTTPALLKFTTTSTILFNGENKKRIYLKVFSTQCPKSNQEKSRQKSLTILPGTFKMKHRKLFETSTWDQEELRKKPSFAVSGRYVKPQPKVSANYKGHISTFDTDTKPPSDLIEKNFERA